MYELIFYLVTLGFLLVWYYGKKFTYWSSRGIPGPTPTLILGNLLPFFKESWVTIYGNWAKGHGKVFGIYEASKPVLVIADADLVKEICIKNFDYFMNGREIGGHPLIKHWLFYQRDDEWRRTRAIISPTFTASKMKVMYHLMEECYQQLDAAMEKVVESKKPVVVRDLLEKLTGTVVAKCALATQINPFTNPNDPVIKNLNQFVRLDLRPIPIFLFPNWLLDLIQYTLPHKGSFLYIFNMCRSIVQQRRKTGARDYPDLLQLMMDSKVSIKSSKDSTPDQESHHTVDGISGTKPSLVGSNSSLTDIEIVANANLFLAAGYETTATAMNSCIYYLARYLDVQEKLHQVIKGEFEDKEMTYETLTGIAYLDAFISEVMRCLPPLLVPERVANADVTLSNGLKIEKGTYVRFPVYSIHHDRDYYPDPEEFRVERFLPENREQIVPGSYLPFFIGPRNCIGMRFALMEMKLTLARLVLKYKFILTQDVLKHNPQFAVSALIMKFTKPLQVIVEKRYH